MVRVLQSLQVRPAGVHLIDDVELFLEELLPVELRVEEREDWLLPREDVLERDDVLDRDVVDELTEDVLLPAHGQTGTCLDPVP